MADAHGVVPFGSADGEEGFAVGVFVVVAVDGDVDFVSGSRVRRRPAVRVPRRTASARRTRWERAVERGQLAAGLDMAAEIDQLVGPFYHRVLVTAEPVDQAFTDCLVETFLHRADVSDVADAGETGSR